MPKISLVVPVYGVEKYINQFLQSIRMQTFQDFEVILVDDGSKDKCPEILDEFVKEDDRYKVIHQSNRGVAEARNTGLNVATGEYVYIVDSDDWLEPTALESLWNEADRTKADIIYGDWVREKSSGSERLHCFPNAFVTEDCDTIKALQFAVNSNNNSVRIARPEFRIINHLGGAPWRGLFKASIIKNNNLRYDSSVKGLGDDILFTLRLYEFVNKVAYIPHVIYHYRLLNASYSHGYKENYFENVAIILKKQEEFLADFQKDELAWKSYYNRVLIYFLSGMQRYFRNVENPKSEKQRYREFIDLVGKDPYKTAIRKVQM